MSKGQFKFLLFIIILAFFGIIAAQNAKHTASISFFFWNLKEIPVLLIIFISIFIGGFGMIIIRFFDSNIKKFNNKKIEDNKIIKRGEDGE